MAATEVSFSPFRAIEALLYIAQRLAKPTVHEVLKIGYFADKLHLARFGWLASGDDYVAMRFGPVGSGTYNLLKAARGDQSGWIHPSFYELVRGTLEVGSDKRSIVPLRSANIDVLSKSHVESIDAALERYANMPFNQRTELSHDAAWHEAWNCAADDEVGQSPMPIESIARTLPNSEEIVAHLRNQPHTVSFGSGFPPEYLLRQLQRRLRPGAVIKLVRRMDDGQLHEKRFVVRGNATETVLEQAALLSA